MMNIIRKSILTGVERSRNINITEEQYERWMNGELIQKVCPYLTDDDREFMMTGITPDEWDSLHDLEEDQYD